MSQHSFGLWLQGREAWAPQRDPRAGDVSSDSRRRQTDLGAGRGGGGFVEGEWPQTSRGRGDRKGGARAGPSPRELMAGNLRG